MEPKTIKASWKKTGIFPFNKQLLLPQALVGQPERPTVDLEQRADMIVNFVSQKMKNTTPPRRSTRKSKAAFQLELGYSEDMVKRQIDKWEEQKRLQAHQKESVRQERVQKKEETAKKKQLLKEEKEKKAEARAKRKAVQTSAKKRREEAAFCQFCDSLLGKHEPVRTCSICHSFSIHVRCDKFGKKMLGHNTVCKSDGR